MIKRLTRHLDELWSDVGSHSLRAYRPEWEADLLDLNRVRTFLTKGQWFRKVSAVGSISIGRHIYHLGHDWRPDGYAEFTFDNEKSEFLCRAPSAEEKHLFSNNEWRALFYQQLPAKG